MRSAALCSCKLMPIDTEGVYLQDMISLNRCGTVRQQPVNQSPRPALHLPALTLSELHTTELQCDMLTTQTADRPD